MGAEHKLDLTKEVTHLLVGDIRTPKYKYVAKERPDVRVLRPEWLEDLRTQWLEGGDVDVQALEEKHRCPALSGLQICVTGFTNVDERLQLESTIFKHGATYSGDLTKQVTHLIVATPQGAKYTHARQWGISCVSLKWLIDSLGRGMALDETLYDPTTPDAEQGKGAFRTEPRSRTSLGKRSREQELQNVGLADGAKRKLRRTASTRLSSHSQDLWNDISAGDVPDDCSKTDQWREDAAPTHTNPVRSAQTPEPLDVQSNHPAQSQIGSLEQEKLFSGWYIYMHGFEASMRKKLHKILEAQCGAHVVSHADELEDTPNNTKFRGSCILVPHLKNDAGDFLPLAPPRTVLATEWWVERCIHAKHILNPGDDALSRPWWNTRVSDFDNVTICSTGFNSLDLRQTAEIIGIAGATYQENLLPSTSVLISASTVVKKEKAYYARKHGIPVVSPAWLWVCLETNTKMPYDTYAIEPPPPPVRNRELSASGSASTKGSPMPDEQSLRSNGQPDRGTDLPPSRLSNTRRHHPTPSLSLHTSATGPKARPSPFIHEDDESESFSVRSASIMSNGVHLSPSSHIRPLKERSPNASPETRRYEADISGDVQRRGTVLDFPQHCSQDEPSVTLLHESVSNEVPAEDPNKSDRQSISKPSEDLSADLASLSRHLLSTRRGLPLADTTDARRKSRKLGRALSSISNRSASASAENIAKKTEYRRGQASMDHLGEPDVTSAAAPAAPPPSTQLGYETSEAEAHRLQMAKRMGTSFADDGGGKRLASIGVVKDSERVTSGGVSRGRGRHKGGR